MFGLTVCEGRLQWDPSSSSSSPPITPVALTEKRLAKLNQRMHLSTPSHPQKTETIVSTVRAVYVQARAISIFFIQLFSNNFFIHTVFSYKFFRQFLHIIL
jgi:hypothetical protein